MPTSLVIQRKDEIISSNPHYTGIIKHFSVRCAV